MSTDDDAAASYSGLHPDDDLIARRKKARWHRADQRRIADRVHALAATTDKIRLAHEVMPLADVLEAYAALSGGELWAQLCDACGQWYCLRVADTGKVRRADSVTKYCSAECAKLGLQQYFRDRRARIKAGLPSVNPPREF